MNFQSLQNLENYNRISKKKSCGPDLPRTGPIRRESSPDPPATRGRGEFKQLANGARRSASLGSRIGMRRPWPFDQVTIDGRRSSSMRERNGAAETLGFRRGTEVLTVASLDGGEGGRRSRRGLLVVEAQ
jgi:hypothetical protein